jgi:hypothetical protein
MAPWRTRNVKQTSTVPRGADRPRHGRFIVTLGTLSTVIAVATGMFTLRDQIFQRESGSALASTAAYQLAVGDICSEVNEAAAATTKDNQDLRAALADAKTVTQERNALLTAAKAGAHRAHDGVAALMGIVPSDDGKSVHRATTTAWKRNAHRLDAHAQRLDNATSQRDIQRAMASLSAARPAIAEDRTAVRAGLEQLGGTECRLERADADPPISLPRRLNKPNHHDAAVPVTSSPSPSEHTTTGQPSIPDGPDASPPQATTPGPDASQPQATTPGPDASQPRSTAPGPDASQPRTHNPGPRR